jgi:hypothetical protein
VVVAVGDGRPGSAAEAARPPPTRPRRDGPRRADQRVGEAAPASTRRRWTGPRLAPCRLGERRGRGTRLLKAGAPSMPSTVWRVGAVAGASNGNADLLRSCSRRAPTSACRSGAARRPDRLMLAARTGSEHRTAAPGARRRGRRARDPERDDGVDVGGHRGSPDVVRAWSRPAHRSISVHPARIRTRP